MAGFTIEGDENKIKGLRKELKLRLKRDKLVIKEVKAKQVRKTKKDD